MKILIGSDIHGSAYWANKFFDLFEREQCDKIVLLGDLLYHGPRNDIPRGSDTMSLIDIFNSYKDKIIAVKGNCDANVDEEVLDFELKDSYEVIEVDDKKWFLSHGHIYNEYNLPPIGSADIMLNGHTHIPIDKDVEGLRILNPGSVSIPKGGSKNSCLLYENGDFKYIEL